jgi:hypothetical protein
MAMESKESPAGERRGVIDAYTQAETAHSVGSSGPVKPRSEERTDNL